MSCSTSTPTWTLFLSSLLVGPETSLTPLWREAESALEKRLWHQLAQVLLKLVRHPDLDTDTKGKLYDNVIQEVDTKLNPVTLVTLCQELLPGLPTSEASLSFMTKVLAKVKSHPEAAALANIQIGNIHLHKEKDLAKTKAVIGQLKEEVDGFDFVGKVHEDFYQLSSDYYKLQGDHAQYYQATLRYLGCFDLKRFEPAAAAAAGQEAVYQATALHLTLAALLGNNVFNFGELLAHPILRFLQSSEHTWLVELLTACNAGDVRRFQSMKPQWSQLVDLRQNEARLYEKVHLLTVMELSFQREAKQRMLTFKEIRDHTDLAPEKVELLVMKALAKGLIRGKLDQVNETLSVTWVQPRVLNKEQVAKLQDKIETWCEAIKSMETLIEQNGGEILTH